MSTNTKQTAESFIGLVKQSGLVDNDLLKKTWKELKERDPQLSDSKTTADELVTRGILTRWQADKLLQGKHKGFFLGKYRLLSHLGSGGMSAVYLAEHTLMRRRVAIKVLPQARIEDSSYLQRFHREAQAVAALDHRNIVRAYDVDQEGKVHFLVMEYVAGVSLHDLVTTKGRIDYVPAMEYIRQAGEGLQHAHRMGMVHRDIKPGNLLLDETGTIKLLDLGLARFFDEKEEASLTIKHDEKVLGTADYLSPEQAIDSHKVDIRSDIYSLGCTLYYLLAGHPPFPDGTLAQRLLAHQTREPLPIRKDRPDIPDGVVAIMEKMMAKKADDRYQTAKEASAAALQWLKENGGATWSRMNPELGGSGTFALIPPPDGEPSGSNVLTSDTVAHPQPRGGTEVGSSPSARAGGSSKKKKTPGSGAAPAPNAHPSSEAELAAFLTQLSVSESSKELAQQASNPPEPTPRVAKPGDSETKSTLPASGRAATPPQTTPVLPAVEPEAVHPVAEPEPIDSAHPEVMDFPDFTAGLESSPASTPPGSSPRVSSDGTGGRRPNKIVLIGAATSALLLIIVAIFVFGRGGTSSTTNPPDKGDSKVSDKSAAGGKSNASKNSVPLRRELKVGAGEKYTSIGAALAEARENFNSARNAVQIIRVASGQTYAERIEMDESYPRGIQIIAEAGPPPLLAPTGPDPIVTVQGGKERLSAFRLEGFHLDATGKDHAIRLADWVPAAQLKQLEIRGFNQAGVLLEGAQTFGADAERIVLEQLTFKNAGPGATGVVLRRKGDDPSHVRIQKCRFLAPLTAGVRVESSLIDLEVLESIFFRTQTGVLLEGAERSWRDVVLAYDTFFENERGLVFTDMPGPDSSGFGFYNNLFVGSQSTDAVVEKNYVVAKFLSMYRTTPGGGGFNWTTRPRQEKPPTEELVYLFEANHGRFGVDDVHFQSTDPDHPEFMLPTPASTNRQVGTMLDKKKFGPQIGALKGK